jgi:hypothetical protein
MSAAKEMTKTKHTLSDLFTIKISNGKAWLGYGSIIILAAVFVLAYELFNWLFR